MTNFPLFSLRGGLLQYVRTRLSLTERIVRDVHCILRILFAFKRQWEPVWKWLKKITSALPLKPAAFQQRLTALFSAERIVDRIVGCFQLMQETLDLVPASIDTEQARLAVR